MRRKSSLRHHSALPQGDRALELAHKLGARHGAAHAQALPSRGREPNLMTRTQHTTPLGNQIGVEMARPWVLGDRQASQWAFVQAEQTASVCVARMSDAHVMDGYRQGDVHESRYDCLDSFNVATQHGSRSGMPGQLEFWAKEELGAVVEYTCLVSAGYKRS